jgi:arsenite methyltransferase
MTDFKQVVKDGYSVIANQEKERNMACCCGAGQCSTQVYNIMSEEYSELRGYEQDADLGLGCGLPTLCAGIRPGDVVVDLGSGAGNDCFVARHEVGVNGKVVGIDFTSAMIEKARNNASRRKYENVEFIEGDIECIPLPDNFANVVVSNCVLNLVPDKSKAFREVFRILKPGGHFCISDVVLTRNLPDEIKSNMEMYVGCIAGAVLRDQYNDIIKSAGFVDVATVKSRSIIIPDDIATIEKDCVLSITVVGAKLE